MQLHLLYEDLTHKVHRFPKANEINWRVLEMCEQLVTDWRMVGPGSLSERRSLVDVRISQFEYSRVKAHLTDSIPCH